MSSRKTQLFSDPMLEYLDEKQDNSFFKKTTKAIQQLISSPSENNSKVVSSNPGKLVQGVDVQVSDQLFLSKFGKEVISEDCLSLSREAFVSENDNATIRNPFSNGVACTIMNRQNKLYLKCSKDSVFQHTPLEEKVYEFQDDEVTVQKRMDVFFRKYRSDALSLCMHFATGNFTMPILIRHVFLYDYYPKEIQDSIWRAMLVYISQQVKNGTYTLFHYHCAQRKVGNIRMYLVKPDDIYRFQNQSDWAAISNKRFLCYMHLADESEQIVMKREKVCKEYFADVEISKGDLGWLFFILSIGVNAKAFPVHYYIKSIAPGVLRNDDEDCIFTYRPKDSLLFQKSSHRLRMTEWLKELRSDLEICKDQRFRQIKKSIYMQPFFHLTKPIGCSDNISNSQSYLCT
ncbi:hypothetical protein SPOG_02910 [Schizosaccharomyces cryophilus OY26]|uniref:Uncharacterized protein n=1 Tax=Schizosaccharomyces cryophilus (strain OY26 / ATCC MYA-4695 / CBS 11777 / NBRC 106824 / NRRL Y48691) TaxID=653667 RepID=S9W826_SCHCR|nr:uncharacterized protein SPOG_02910 [Schizosaccharomyces cryophilus OY26]EPY53860.1 hypothetical protein SPOG_02910 [Schizosaccharomyces cryophilus OY26]